MIKPRAIADRNHQRVVNLIGLRAIGSDIAFHQRRTCGLADLQHRAREHRRGRSTAGDMDDMQGLCEHGAIGNLDHEAIRHHRAIERHRGIGVFGREQ